MAHPYWPLFDLRIRTPLVELRSPTDDDLVELIDLAGRGVHPPDYMPFSIPWTSAPSPEREFESLKFYWRSRALWQPTDWSLTLLASCRGTIVGTQGIAAKAFPTTRSVGTGSWLGMEHQGKGIGKEMRQAVLHLAFDGLGALEARSGAWHDNAASIGVSRAVGYAENGETLVARLGEPTRQLGFRMSRANWESRRRDDIEIEGLERCLPMFGLGGDTEEAIDRAG